jgi:alkylation response protein AidB-like acyl-CoA dehydrogenase
MTTNTILEESPKRLREEMAEAITKGGSFLVNITHPDNIFTPEDMNVNQKLIAKILEEFVRGEVEPRIKELESKTEGLMLELLKKGASMGWQGVDVPKEFGGFGLDKTTSLIVTEQVSSGGPFALANMVHSTFGTLPILYFGNNEQKNRYLPDLAKGKKIAAFALTEPDVGSDALGVKTTATLSDDGQYYILNGTKQFISNTGYADVFITYAKIDGEKFTAFIVDRDSKGVSFGEEEDKMGIRGTSTRSLTLENVKVPVKNLIFYPGKGHMVAFNTLNIGRYKLGGACVGAAKLAFKDSISYVKNRYQFGKSISNFGLIKEKIAEMAIRIFVGESMAYRTSKLLEDRLKTINITSNGDLLDLAMAIKEFAPECSINKVYASEMLDYVVDEAVQIHGGYGYIKDYPVERYYRDSRINRIFGGTNEINRLLILRMLLKRGIKGELPLINAMEKVISERAASSVDTNLQEKWLRELANLVENTKKVALLSLKTVIQTYPYDLEDHQELMGMISNIIIEVFAMESSLLRTQKIKQRWGEEKAEIPTAISQVYILDALMRVERWAKLIFAAVADEDMLQNQILNLRKLTQYMPVNSVALRRMIADFMLKGGRYFIL